MLTTEQINDLHRLYVRKPQARRHTRGGPKEKTARWPVFSGPCRATKIFRVGSGGFFDPLPKIAAMLPGATGAV